MRWTKLALGLVDVLSVCGVIAYSALHERSGVGATGWLAAGMWCWHSLENEVWPRRHGVRGAPLYPSGMVWIHLAYSATLCTGLAEALGSSPYPSLAPRWQEVGLALFASGTALRLWAFSALGAGFLSAPSPGSRESRSGPYRWLRHPASWGFLAIALGTTLALGSAWALFAALVTCVPALGHVNLREGRERAGNGLPSPAKEPA